MQALPGVYEPLEFRDLPGCENTRARNGLRFYFREIVIVHLIESVGIVIKEIFRRSPVETAQRPPPGDPFVPVEDEAFQHIVEKPEHSVFRPRKKIVPYYKTLGMRCRIVEHKMRRVRIPTLTVSPALARIVETVILNNNVLSAGAFTLLPVFVRIFAVADLIAAPYDIALYDAILV